MYMFLHCQVHSRGEIWALCTPKDLNNLINLSSKPQTWRFSLQWWQLLHYFDWTLWQHRELAGPGCLRCKKLNALQIHQNSVQTWLGRLTNICKSAASCCRKGVWKTHKCCRLLALRSVDVRQRGSVVCSYSILAHWRVSILQQSKGPVVSEI